MKIEPSHILGIRHHGPGSARAVQHALLELQPDVILIEGPAEASDLWLPTGLAGFEPPVAMLFYQSDAFGNAFYFPFAEYSPEWIALQYADAHGIPVRWMDLPAAISLANQEDEEGTFLPPLDPLGEIAEAAGYEDREQWWEVWMETRADYSGIFASIHALMEAARAEHPHETMETLRREAWMRSVLRQAEKEFENPVVICGAWHVPALTGDFKVGEDQALLKGLQKVKVSGTWIPFTYSQLSALRGYGAGVISPEWYQMVWNDRDKAVIHWMVKAARLLRSEDIGASSASVIEAVRLADALAAMRGRSIPGLTEMVDAVRTVLFHGYDHAMRLVRDRLIIGNRLGKIPAEVGQSPLERDVAAEMKRLRLAPKAEVELLELDLRKDLHLERSKFLHRLLLLGVNWGTKTHSYGKKGTFHEAWSLEWRPEFSLQLVGLQVWGNTLGDAAARYALHRVLEREDAGLLGEVMDLALKADLPEAVDSLMKILEERAAGVYDVSYLLALLPQLVETYRYGNVRGTSGTQIRRVLDSIVPRIATGLPASVLNLDEDASRKSLGDIRKGNGSIRLLDVADHSEIWVECLLQMAELPAAPPLVKGGVMRLLLDAEVIASDKAMEGMWQALSPGMAPLDGALWLEGFLSDNALLLVNHPGLWQMINDWLAALAEEVFVENLPLLRRTFSQFSMADRARLRNMVGQTGAAASATPAGWDRVRGERVIPALLSFMGLQKTES